MKIHKGTTFAVALDASALICILSGYYLPVAFAALIAYFASIAEVAKYTSLFQFITVSCSALILGVALDLPPGAFPFATVALFLAACGSTTRMAFFAVFSYTGLSWFEPLVFAISCTFYIAGGFLVPFSWSSWLLPLPILIFNGILGWGILKDKSQLLAKTKGGYRIQLGKPAIAFELPDQDGQLVSLSDFLDKRHLLLVFVRGDWCPGCHMMLRTYEKHNATFQRKNVFVMAIGPDPVGVNREMVEKLGLDFKVLSDEGQKTAMAYGVQLAEYDNSFAEKYEAGIPLPASFLIDKQGIIRYVSRPDKVGEFLNPALIFPIVEQLS